MDLKTRINRIYDKLTAPEKQILNYIETQYEQVLTMTSQELAAHCFVSRNTIFRLLKKLEIESFAEFKFFLKQSKVDKIEESSDFVNIVSYYHLYIDQIFSKLRLSSIVDLLAKTQVLYLYGTGNEQKLVIEYFRQLFTNAGKKVVVIFDEGEYDYTKVSFKKNDLLCVLSYKGEREDTVRLIDEAKVLGVKTLAITRTSQNRLSQHADYQLYVPTESISTPTKRDYEISTTFYFIIERLFLTYQERTKR